MTKPYASHDGTRSSHAWKRCSALLITALSAAYGSAFTQEPLSTRSPEALAGRWEAPDGRGGAIGMNIMLTTHIESPLAGLAAQPQYEDEFTVGLYQRTGPDPSPLDMNGFSNAAGGGMRWDGHHLSIHYPPKGDLPKTDVDLLWHENSQTWTGFFERGSFSGQVSLKRPASAAPRSPFVGTWSDERGLMNNCLHISQASSGALIAWSDDVQRPGRICYAHGIQPPTQITQRYGDIAVVTLDDPHRITVDLQAYTPTCCPHPFLAKLSADGQSLIGRWQSGGNQQSRPVTWTRMPGGSCLSSPVSSAR